MCGQSNFWYVLKMKEHPGEHMHKHLKATKRMMNDKINDKYLFKNKKAKLV